MTAQLFRMDSLKDLEVSIYRVDFLGKIYPNKPLLSIPMDLDRKSDISIQGVLCHWNLKKLCLFFPPRTVTGGGCDNTFSSFKKENATWYLNCRRVRWALKAVKRWPPQVHGFKCFFFPNAEELINSSFESLDSLRFKGDIRAWVPKLLRKKSGRKGDNDTHSFHLPVARWVSPSPDDTVYLTFWLIYQHIDSLV